MYCSCGAGHFGAAVVQNQRYKAFVGNLCFADSSQALYESGIKIKGTDVATWISIMSERSVPHLQRGTATSIFNVFYCFTTQTKLITLFDISVFQRYRNYSPYDMQESITKEVKGDLQKSFLVLGTTVFDHFLLLAMTCITPFAETHYP